VGGDGIGTEVTAQARRVIEAVLPDSEFDVLSAALLLEHLGHPDKAERVTDAVAAEVASRTPGVSLRTNDVGDRIAATI
jgi:3-isopropylmalate dehydrogenase